MNRFLRPTTRYQCLVRNSSQQTRPPSNEADGLISFPIDKLPANSVNAPKNPQPVEEVKKPSTHINFSDPRAAFKSKTLSELIRGKLVFTACQYKPLVNNSEALIKFSYDSLGLTITNFFLKRTFFGHFCAGEDEKTIDPTVKRLQSGGVGSILDYAAESDVATDNDKDAKKGPKTADDLVNIPTSTTVGKVQSRVYDYKNESVCDGHLQTFLRAVQAVHDVSPTGFAAIKCTALGNPELLKRVSITLTEIRNLFHALDKENSGFITKEDFLKTFNTKIEGKDVLTYYNTLDTDQDGKIDYIEWTNGLRLEDLHLLTAHCTVKGPLFQATLTEEERELLKAMKERVHILAKEAEKSGVRLMIDAEHTYFQPAIDHLTHELSRIYNHQSVKFPIIFSTYQMYLKDSRSRLLTDLDRAKKGNYKFAAKLVRGAYMVLERQYARDKLLSDPILPNIQTTHDNYNFALKECIKRISQGDNIEIMIASHNQGSIELAVQTMNEYNLPPASGVYFGQLLGMSDHLTFSLGSNGYKAYKYVPYGKVNEVMPYLIRRAQENSDALSGAKIELEMINQEIRRRLFG